MNVRTYARARVRAYADFDPSTPIEQALTIVFLFVGVGFMGSLIGIVASRQVK